MEINEIGNRKIEKIHEPKCFFASGLDWSEEKENTNYQYQKWERWYQDRFHRQCEDNKGILLILDW
jgi:hypothetical protein